MTCVLVCPRTSSGGYGRERERQREKSPDAWWRRIKELKETEPVSIRCVSDIQSDFELRIKTATSTVRIARGGWWVGSV